MKRLRPDSALRGWSVCKVIFDALVRERRHNHVMLTPLRAGLLVFVFGCTDTPREPAPATAPQEPAPAAPDAAVAQTAASDAGASTPPDSASNASEEVEARALIERWLSAQNSGDFDTYASLYAKRAYGEKRAGPRLYKFDRAGWLADRKRMFERPMKVSVSDLRVTPRPGATLVAFEQSFSQATFQDRGQKRITLVREDGVPRISTEIMLASTLTSASPEVARDFYFVVHAGGRRYVLLESGAKRAWGKGPAKLMERPGDATFVAVQEIGELPSEQAKWRGASLRVHGAHGQNCEGTIRSLHLMAAVIPHFGTAAVWRGESSDFPGPPYAPQAIADAVLRDVWEPDLALAGELGGACDGVFATSSQRSVKVYAANEPSPELAARAREQVLGTPLFKKALREFRAGRAAPKAAWQPEQDIVLAHGSGPELLTVYMNTGGGCDEYTDTLTALVRRDGDGLSPLALAREPLSQAPRLVLDLDQDGVIELIVGAGDFDRSLQRLVNEKIVPLKSAPRSFQDCGC